MTMTLIEGVGDEVTLFFVLAVLVAMACLAWLTTRVTDRPLRIQTIIVGQRVIHVDERGEPTSGAAAAEGEGGAGPEPPGPAEPPEPDCEEDGSGEVEVALREDGEQEQEQRQEQGQRSSGDGADADGSREEAVAVEHASQVTAPVEAGREECEASAESGVEISPAAPVPGPVPDPVPDTVPDPVPDTVPDPVPDTVPDTLSDTVPDTVHDPVSDSVSDTVADSVSDMASDPASDMASDPASDPASDARQQLRRRRLAFMARQATEPGTPAPSDAQRTAQDTPPTERTPSDTSSTERTAADTTQRTAPDTTQRTAEASEPSESGQSITVKLKFLNDTQRLVEGGRTEPLGDFKRRHFPSETAANRIVRLIFNGRVLPDQETLGQCGLYHNCVVHCHVSAGPRPADGGGAVVPGGGGGAAPDLDIGVLLYPVLTSVVTLVWGLRLRYPDLFSGTAVLLLAVLTLLLACFAAATFLPLERLPGGAAVGAAAAGRQQQRGR